MFKVIAPIEHRDGTHHWARCGNGYSNKDGSINLYLSTLPVATKNGELTLQLRELTEEELRERSERRGSFTSPAANANHLSRPAADPADSLPF
jgi:hypothetical protein